MWGITLAFLAWAGLSPLPLIADAIGTTEPALKLLISIIMAYPLALFYHKYIRQHPKFRNAYSIISGLDMAFFNFGMQLYHNAIPVVVIYLTTKIFGPGKENAIITFVFNMGYLLMEYVFTESENYDITYSMPQCVLTLKLIALSFDLWDGKKIEQGIEVSENNKKTALEKAPEFLELVGFVFFPSCFLVGPIFSFRRYSDFINEKFPLDEHEAEYKKQAISRLIQGILYLIAFQVGVTVFNSQYMMSNEFKERSIFYKHFYCGLWAHFALYKYISCWLLTEASCIRFGLSYNGTAKGADGMIVSRWDGCSNIKLVRFECATKFQHYVDSFNINTNYFASEYIYKRLKFLGNRNISQLLTLMFLAVWHGIRSGYYMTFFNEFMIILMEKELEAILSKSEIYNKIWTHTTLKYPLYVLLKIYTIIFMGWSLIPFDLKEFSKWWSLYSTLYFSGFLLFAPWSLVYKQVLVKIMKSSNHSKSQ